MKVAVGLLAIFLLATQGCGGPNLVLYKPDVDPAQIQADKRECQEKAELYIGDGPMIGSRRSELDRYYEDCMKAKGYQWVEEKDAHK